MSLKGSCRISCRMLRIDHPNERFSCDESGADPGLGGSHEESEIRTIPTSGGDVLAFTLIHGTWISEEIEPVAIEFAWQRRRASPVTSEGDCVCPKELAARLIQTLFAGGEQKGSGCGCAVCLQHSMAAGSPSTKLKPLT